MTKESARPCGCDPGATPRPHLCERHLDEANMALNARAGEVHAANKRWWCDLHTGAPLARDYDEMFMLIVSELSEAMEGDRKNLMDDKLPHRRMLEVEIADAYIRVLDLAGHDFLGQLRVEDVRGRVTSRVGGDLFSLVKIIVWAAQQWSAHRASVLLAALMEFARTHNLDLEGAFEEKMQYNATRHDHTREGRLEAHGKKY